MVSLENERNEKINTKNNKWLQNENFNEKILPTKSNDAITYDRRHGIHNWKF